MPGGRPSPIDRVIGHRDVDGTPVPVTVAERILSALRAGNYVEGAAASAGVHKETVYEWQRVAARARIAGKTDADLTAHERRCIEFSDAVDEAEATWEAQANTTLEQLGRGGIPLVTETVKVNAKGAVVEKTTKTSATLPDANVIMWRLKRKFRDRYAERIELTGKDGAPLLSNEDRAAALVERVGQVKRERAAPAKPKLAPKKRATRSGAGKSAKSPRAGNDPQA